MRGCFLHDPIAVAQEMCILHHKGQYDLQGVPYAEHPFAVASNCTDRTERIVAYLHDLVEDTPVTLTDIAQMFGTDIAGHVDSLTRRIEETYDEFITRILSDPVAIRVKIEDIRHNMSRLSGLEEKKRNTLEARYTKALTKLLAEKELMLEHQ